MDFYDFKSHADLGSFKGQGSNTWGWVSDTGREFVAVGQVSTSNLDARSSYPSYMPRFVEPDNLAGTNNASDIRELFISPLASFLSSEILLSEDCSLTGIERDSTHEGR
jgi:hypothetical protein